MIVGACVVDEDYQGEIFIHLINVGRCAETIMTGMKIAQFILTPVSYEDVDEVNCITKRPTAVKAVSEAQITKEMTQTFFERLITERNELEARLEGVERLLEKGFNAVAEIVGKEQCTLLISQKYFMRSYLDVLEVRIGLLEAEQIENDKK